MLYNGTKGDIITSDGTDRTNLAVGANDIVYSNYRIPISGWD